MKSPQPSRPIVDIFTKSFRRHVHLLVVWGHELAIDNIQSTDLEEYITNFLFDAIDTVLCSGGEKWFKYYDVHNERPISSKNRYGNSRREVDLIIKLVAHPYKPEYVFEAKSLNYIKNHQRENNYINESALQRFLKGEYADYTGRYPEVGMIGYVLSDSVEQWRDRLKTAIDNNKALLRLYSKQSDVAVITELPYEWMSEHERSSASTPIRIYHLLLNCR